MKKPILSVIVLFAAILAMMAFTFPTFRMAGDRENPPQEKVTPAFPDDVQKVLETSCSDCHGEATINTKAKSKLNLSKWNDLSDVKKVAKMEAISEVVTKGEMPPEKYVTKYPEHALTQAQKDLINKWTADESAKLMGK